MKWNPHVTFQAALERPGGFGYRSQGVRGLVGAGGENAAFEARERPRGRGAAQQPHDGTGFQSFKGVKPHHTATSRVPRVSKF